MKIKFYLDNLKSAFTFLVRGIIKSNKILQYDLMTPILILLCSVVLLLPDQSLDIFMSMIQKGFFGHNFLLPLLSSILWSFVLYYASRINIEVFPNDAKEDPNRLLVSTRLSNSLPKIYACSPQAIMFLGIINAAIYKKSFFSIFSNLNACLELIFLIMLVAVLVIAFRKIEAKFLFPLTVKRDENFGNLFTMSQYWHDLKGDFQYLFHYKQTLYYLIITFISTVLLFILFVIPVHSFGGINIKIARLLTTPAIGFLAFAVFTYFFGIISFLNDFRSRPFLFLVLGYMFIISGFNENADIEQISNKKITTNQTIIEHFESWYRYKIIDMKTDTTKIPLILVAGEGGGIRAQLWTAQVLESLSQIPKFKKYLFAVSGVSGGGVGATLYTSILSDSLNNNQLSYDQKREILSSDYLSPITSMYFFGDGIGQALLPTGIQSFDRSKRLADSWAYTYKQVSQSQQSILDSSFHDLWNKIDQKKRYELPSLFLNGTLAESGQKAITSNLPLDSTYFRDVVDVFRTTQKQMPVKTAMTLCCRFPVLTNGGLLNDKNNSKYGHVTDGGYFENTGIETCIQIINTIRQSKKFKNVQPFIIFIKNSEYINGDIKTFGQAIKRRENKERDEEPETKKVYGTGRFFKTILGSFINSWDRGSITKNNALQKFLKEYDINYFCVQLPRYKQEVLPLGWTLSDSAKTKIENYSQLAKIKETFNKSDGTKYNQLIELLR